MRLSVRFGLGFVGEKQVDVRNYAIELFPKRQRDERRRKVEREEFVVARGVLGDEQNALRADGDEEAGDGKVLRAFDERLALARLEMIDCKRVGGGEIGAQRPAIANVGCQHCARARAYL